MMIIELDTIYLLWMFLPKNISNHQLACSFLVGMASQSGQVRQKKHETHRITKELGQ